MKRMYSGSGKLLVPYTFLAILVSSNALIADDKIIADEFLTVVSVDDALNRVGVEITYVKIHDADSYSIGFKNPSVYPISIIGTVIFYDSTGVAYFVNGGLDITSEIASQIALGQSESEFRCMTGATADDYAGIGTYHCVRSSFESLLNARLVLIVVTSADIDMADRD